MARKHEKPKRSTRFLKTSEVGSRIKEDFDAAKKLRESVPMEPLGIKRSVFLTLIAGLAHLAKDVVGDDPTVARELDRVEGACLTASVLDMLDEQSSKPKPSLPIQEKKQESVVKINSPQFEHRCRDAWLANNQRMRIPS